MDIPWNDAVATLASCLEYLNARLCIWVLETVEHEEHEIRLSLAGHAQAGLWINPDYVIQRLDLPAWMIRHAKRWEDRKKKGRLD